MSSLFDVPAHLALVLSLAASTASNEPPHAYVVSEPSAVASVATLDLRTIQGSFRFSEGAWLRALRDSLPPEEAPDIAAGIFRTSGGRYYVPAADERERILNGRQNLALAARVAQAFAQTNARTLWAALHRAPTVGELYIAHIFGPEAAPDLVRWVESSPGAVAATRLPDLAKAAPELFAQGTFAQVYQRLTAAVAARIPKRPPRVVVLADPRTTFDNSPDKFVLLGMGQNMALMRAPPAKLLAWQTQVSAALRGGAPLQ